MKNKVFMAFGKAVESKEASPIKRYIGLGAVSVLAVNPSKEELENIYGTTLDKEPEYLGSMERNGQNIPYVRIDFLVKTNPERCNGIEMITKIPFFIMNQKMVNRDNTKVQVIDKYARTAWVTKEEFAGKLIPQYSNGPARIDSDYRPVYNGEEHLIKFIKNFLCIDDVDEYANGTWRMRKNPEDCVAQFLEIDKWFKGDVSEIKNAIAIMPHNMIKVLFGVRTTDEGKEYQDVYTRASMRLSSNSTKALEKSLAESKENGAYSHTEFEVCPIKEYVVKPTDLSATGDDDLPFADDDPFKGL